MYLKVHRLAAVLVTAPLLLGTIGVAASEEPSPAPAENGAPTVPGCTRVGFSLGTPAGLNLVFTTDAKPTTIVLSGMYWGAVRGFQIEASIVRSQRTRNFRSFNVSLGTSDIAGDTWTYAGLTGFFSWRSFFLEPGLSAGTGDFSSPQVTFQLGFLWSL